MTHAIRCEPNTLYNAGGVLRMSAFGSWQIPPEYYERDLARCRANILHGIDVWGAATATQIRGALLHTDTTFQIALYDLIDSNAIKSVNNKFHRVYGES